MSDPLDVLTLTEAQGALGVADSDAETIARLAGYVTAVSRRLDTAVGPIVQRSVTEFHDGGEQWIWLNLRPASAIASVIEYDATEPTTVNADTHAAAFPDGFTAVKTTATPTLFEGTLWRRSDGSPATWAAGHQNVQVVYTAGRFATTAAVDARFKQAALLFLRNLWRQEQQGVVQVGEYLTPVSNFPAFAIPNAVRELLADQWHVAPGGWA